LLIFPLALFSAAQTGGSKAALFITAANLRAARGLSELAHLPGGFAIWKLCRLPAKRNCGTFGNG
jgi:hypothetical protein